MASKFFALSRYAVVCCKECSESRVINQPQRLSCSVTVHGVPLIDLSIGTVHTGIVVKFTNSSVTNLKIEIIYVFNHGSTQINTDTIVK